MDIATARGEFPVTIDDGDLAVLKGQASRSGSDVFALRYKFRPDSLDNSTPMSIAKDKDDYVVEANAGTDNEYIFSGQATAAKDAEYVLVYDAEKETFRLHPLDFTMRVSRSREKRRAGQTLMVPTRGAESASMDSPAYAASPSAPSPNAPSRSVSPVTKPEVTKPEVTKPEVTKPEVTKPEVTKPEVSSTSKPSRPRAVAKKAPAPTQPVVAVDEDEDDDDLLGALANELEESLEDESNKSKDDSDSDEGVKVTIIEPQAPVRNFASPSLGAGRPMSLRGLVSSSGPADDDLSSSEEE